MASETQYRVGSLGVSVLVLELLRSTLPIRRFGQIVCTF
jgi:hypothetical protein